MDDDRQHQEEQQKESSSECSSREHKNDPISIKLKISTPTQGNGSKEVKDPVVKTCEYCGKEFMNGKALGGHIRIHTQEGKLKGGGGEARGGTISRKLKRKIDELDLGSAEREDAIGNGEERVMLYSCCICGKRFPTNKSLCGHMRFHPERSWRGVMPPKMSEGHEKEEEEGGKEEEVGGDIQLFSEVDLLKDLQGWSKTEKRGRISLSGVEPEAARGLMKLASAIPYNSSSSDDGEGDHHTPGLKKKDREEIRQSSEKDFKIPEAEDPSKIATIVCPVIHEKKAGRIRFRFECITCHKIFPTFQALDGHRSVHNKDHGSITNSIKEEQNTHCYCQAGNLCESCQEKAPDQELLVGGTTSPPTAEASESGPTPRLVLPIDLNEIPTKYEEDEGLKTLEVKS